MAQNRPLKHLLLQIVFVMFYGLQSEGKATWEMQFISRKDMSVFSILISCFYSWRILFVKQKYFKSIQIEYYMRLNIIMYINKYKYVLFLILDNWVCYKYLTHNLSFSLQWTSYSNYNLISLKYIFVWKWVLCWQISWRIF